MMMKGSTTIAVTCAVLLVAQLSNEACAFSIEQLSRRESLQALIGGVATAIVPSVVSILPALAEEGDEEVAAAEVAVAPKVVYHSTLDEETPRSVTRMGGLLVGLLSSHSIIPVFCVFIRQSNIFCRLTPNFGNYLFILSRTYT
jgi:hypothetical protein